MTDLAAIIIAMIAFFVMAFIIATGYFITLSDQIGGVQRDVDRLEASNAE